jgi:CSLREA domain-containing protein
MIRILRFSLAILFIFMTFASTKPVYAAGIVVNALADDSADDGLCTLREAITNANADSQLFATAGECAAGSGADTITFDANYTITLGSQLPAVTTALTINGTGLANTIIQANANFNVATYRIFEVTGTGNLTLNALTVQNGRCNGSCSGDASFGGGIYNAGGDLTITNSKIANNSATEGGNVFTSYTNSSLTVANSIFSGDPAVISTYGGAIMNGGSIITITNSTFSNNFTTNRGGAIYNDGPPSNVNIITNSTFSGNTASAEMGGAIYNSATLTITNSTFSGNSGSTSNGAAINNAVSETLNLYNTIIANSVGGKDCINDGTINAGNNLIENGTTYACGLTNNVDGNIIGQDPAINALTDNGGTTETFALLTSSPALGAGDNTICDDNPGPNNLDQRGVPRPQSGSCDIGAFESNAQQGPTFVVNTDEDSNDGFCDAYIADITDCTLREAINYASSIGGADTITFADNYTITLGSELPAVTDTITINGNGAINTIIQANAAPNTANHRIFHVSTGNLILNQMTIRHGVCNGLCASAGTVGGGIYVTFGGTLAINNSLISANYADDGGAGLYNSQGTVIITNSTFSDHSFPSSGTITNNGSMTIANSTIKDNTATGANYAGGIRNLATLDIYNSTISGNTSNGIIFEGANIVQESGTLNLYNTIVANGINDGDCGIYGGTISATNTLIESTGPFACNNLANGANGNIIGSDPNLGPLTGFPAYFPLNTGSLAINAGNDAICAAAPVSNTSQNGMTRPQGAHCDIGAFEANATITLKSVNTNDGWILESTETSGAGGTLNSTATTFNLGDDAADRQYRVILHFDTSSLPDNAVITSATLKIKKQGVMGTDPFTLLGDLKASVRKPAFGAATLTVSDFKSAPGKNNVATFSNIPVSNWYSALVNNTGRVYINRLGTTQFRLAFTTDDNNDNGVDLMKFYSGNAGAANRPQLIIQYYIP